MPDTDVIDPTVDRVWAVDVAPSGGYTAYVVAKTAGEAEHIAEDDADDLEPTFSARELSEPLPEADGNSREVPSGRSRWDGHKLTVNEAVDLVASHRPVYDDQTLLMPFAEGPPPLYPPRMEDYLAGGGCPR
jgi:hypothetical protein